MITIHNVDQGSEDWFKLKEDKFSASAASKLLTSSDQYKIENGKQSPYSAYSKDKFSGSFWTERGHVLEDEAIEMFERIYRTTVLRIGGVENSNYPNCFYSPDALLPNTVIEVKCFDKDKHLKLIKTPKQWLPVPITSQVQFGMMMCEVKLGLLIFYHPKVDPKDAFRVVEIKRSPAIQANIKRKLKEGAENVRN